MYLICSHRVKQSFHSLIFIIINWWRVEFQIRDIKSLLISWVKDCWIIIVMGSIWGWMWRIRRVGRIMVMVICKKMMDYRCKLMIISFHSNKTNNQPAIKFNKKHLPSRNNNNNNKKTSIIKNHNFHGKRHTLNIYRDTLPIIQLLTTRINQIMLVQMLIRKRNDLFMSLLLF